MLADRKLEWIADDAVRRIAHIIGEHSAASQALAEAVRRRLLGEDVAIFATGKHLIVGPRPTQSSEAT